MGSLLLAGTIVTGFAWIVYKATGVEGPHDPDNDKFDNPFHP